MEGFKDTSLDEMHGSVAAIIGEKNARMKEITKRQDMMMSRMSDELCELKSMLQNLQEGGNGH